jgi:hypothetical protein
VLGHPEDFVSLYVTWITFSYFQMILAWQPGAKQHFNKSL